MEKKLHIISLVLNANGPGWPDPWARARMDLAAALRKTVACRACTHKTHEVKPFDVLAVAPPHSEPSVLRSHEGQIMQTQTTPRSTKSNIILWVWLDHSRPGAARAVASYAKEKNHTTEHNVFIFHSKYVTNYM